MKRTPGVLALAQCWIKDTFVILSILTILRRLLCRVMYTRISLRRLSLRLKHRCLLLQDSQWHADYNKLSSQMSNGRIGAVTGCAYSPKHTDSERLLPKYLIQRHTGLTPSIMVWGVTVYSMRFHPLQIPIKTLIIH